MQSKLWKREPGKAMHAAFILPLSLCSPCSGSDSRIPSYTTILSIDQAMTLFILIILWELATWCGAGHLTKEITSRSGLTTTPAAEHEPASQVSPPSFLKGPPKCIVNFVISIVAIKLISSNFGNSSRLEAKTQESHDDMAQLLLFSHNPP
jgi:hypothetical protein